MIMTETGTLKVGVEHEGAVHKEFEIREQLVMDSVEVMEDPKTGARATASDSFFSIAVMGKRITKLGAIPKEAITPGLIMTMHQDDYSEISAADKRLEEKRRTFQG
jgi:hypothetical protein